MCQNLMPHIPVTGLAGFDLYADGEYYGTFVPPMDVKDGYDHILEFSEKKLREITIHMPLYCDVKSVLVGLQNTALLEKAKPVYETLPGWKCDIRGTTDYAALPQQARDYVDFIEARIGYPITMVSTGPKRHEITHRK